MELINQIAALRKEVTNLNSQLRNQDCKRFHMPYSLLNIAKLQAIQNQGLLESQQSMNGGQDFAAKLMQNQMASSQSFENTQVQMQDLQIKRQYIEELRKKLNILIEENRYLKSEMAAANNQALAQHHQGDNDEE